MTDDLPPGFAPLPCTEAEARRIRRMFGVTARQVEKENNRLRVLMGRERSEAAREARRAQGDATAVRIRAELAVAPAGKREAAVEGVCEALRMDRATVFRALARPRS